MAEKFGFDAPRFTRDEATELCVYHLRMAAALFQLVPDDDNVSIIAEIRRQTADDLVSVDTIPMIKWAREMYLAYEEMKERD